MVYFGVQYFRPNPYFENEVISKEVVMEGSGETAVINTPIHWKEGKVCLCACMHACVLMYLPGIV